MKRAWARRRKATAEAGKQAEQPPDKSAKSDKQPRRRKSVSKPAASPSQSPLTPTVDLSAVALPAELSPDAAALPLRGRVFPRMAPALERQGVATIGDLAKYHVATDGDLARLIGPTGRSERKIGQLRAILRQHAPGVLSPSARGQPQPAAFANAASPPSRSSNSSSSASSSASGLAPDPAEPP